MAVYFGADHVVWASQAGIFTNKQAVERCAPGEPSQEQAVTRCTPWGGGPLAAPACLPAAPVRASRGCQARSGCAARARGVHPAGLQVVAAAVRRSASAETLATWGLLASARCMLQAAEGGAGGMLLWLCAGKPLGAPHAHSPQALRVGQQAVRRRRSCAPQRRRQAAVLRGWAGVSARAAPGRGGAGGAWRGAALPRVRGYQTLTG